MTGYLKERMRTWAAQRKANDAQGIPNPPTHPQALNRGPAFTCTPEKTAPFLDELRHHATQAQAAFVINVADVTICHWKRRFPDFTAQIEQALKDRGPFIRGLWLANYTLTHPNGPFPKIRSNNQSSKKIVNPTIRHKNRPHKRTYVQEQNAQTKERQQRRAFELEQRRQTIKKWQKKAPEVLPQLKAMWAKRDADSLILPRLKEYTCELCNRPFTTIRKIRATAHVYCPPCAKFARLKVIRDSYYRHWTERRATANAKKRAEVREKRLAAEDRLLNQTQHPKESLPKESLPKEKIVVTQPESQFQPRTYRKSSAPVIVWQPEEDR